MSKDKHPESIADQDYDDIQVAVMETERGRWFLNEFAMRNRVADTAMLLDAIKKLEKVVGEKEHIPSIDPEVEKMRFNIVEMANAIAATKREIAEIEFGSDGDSRLDMATAELDSIVTAAETATSDILTAAEHIQEVAWTMRENGAKEADFEKLDGCATDIYMACSFQDITGQRISKVIAVLQFLENHVMTMMNIWGIEGTDHDSRLEEKSTSTEDSLLNGPALEGQGIDQDDIDLMLADEEELFGAVAQPAEQMVSEATFAEDNISAEPEIVEVGQDDVEFKASEPKTDIDDLSQTDKIALFT